MAEKSLPWDGDSGSGGVGDCGPYTSNAWDDLYRCAFLTDQQASEGVLKGLDGELEVTGTATPVSVAIGGAIVNGKFYYSSSPKSVDVPAPVSATRIDRIVLRADYAAQTVRIARLAGAEGEAAPALTQNDGVTWEISLAQISVTTAGVITVTDERVFCHFGTAVNNAMLDSACVTASKIANSAVTNAKLNHTCHRMRGEIIMWSGALGSGANAHYPVDPALGAANLNWHICNGDVEGGVTTPDLRDRFIVAQGPSYALGDTGGSATKDLSHTHDKGALAVAAHSSHTHPVDIKSAAGSTPYHLAGEDLGELLVVNTAKPDHTHQVTGNTGAGGAAGHVVSGSTDLGGSPTQDILPPYYCLIFLCYVGA